MNIVAVTSCISGVAYTYMAAELLEQQCQQKGMNISIETQGAFSSGVSLTDEEIHNADVVVIITDTEIKGMQRFADCRQIKTDITGFLRNQIPVLQAIEKILETPPNTVKTV
ncbi:PTS fructose transporter subunit IIB [Vibrio albus]|uniref:protein-N(pi)-phosphohistidine--D-fructose phosphotransferase n=1 Tax=Vibrio albus TaxID=2200953 RepID=A0A2U3B788_9VIBR|nr:fructose PTS transporter subunit IIB [Vibrio albus]PWI32651.1 PTS fructose transporter subunit IIB [Vibrio albus]